MFKVPSCAISEHPLPVAGSLWLLKFFRRKPADIVCAAAVMTDCFRPRDQEGSSFFGNLFGGDEEEGSKSAAVAENLIARQLATKLDVDILGKNFGRFAGGDQMMDQEECVVYPPFLRLLFFAEPLNNSVATAQHMMSTTTRQGGTRALHMSDSSLFSFF